VEIFCAPQHLDWRNKAQIEELGHWFRDSELKLHSLHSPLYTDEIWGRSGPQSHINITSRAKATRLQWVGEIKRALEIAEIIPFRYLVQHIGAGEQEYSEESVEFAFTSLEELSIFARQRGVEILLENIPNGLSSAQRLADFNAQTHLNLNYVFDTGHAHLGAGIAHEFEIMKPRIRSLHVHDNDGKSDQHLFPGAPGGTIDWTRTMELLRSCPGQYPLLLELREVASMEHPLDEILGAFDRLESLESTHA
jgi:sugar phosphate isomerase/epimerase